MTKEIESYRLERITHKRGGIRTAAFIQCNLCNAFIDSMGGPGKGYICIKCGELIESGRLRGCISHESINPQVIDAEYEVISIRDEEDNGTKPNNS